MRVRHDMIGFDQDFGVMESGRRPCRGGCLDGFGLIQL